VEEMLEVPDHSITKKVLLLIMEVLTLRGKHEVPKEARKAEKMAKKMGVDLRDDEQGLVAVAPKNAPQMVEQMGMDLRNDEQGLVAVAPKNAPQMDVALRNDEKALWPLRQGVKSIWHCTSTWPQQMKSSL
jgi:hypothetical protein